MNKTLKLLIFSDVFILSGWGLVSPIFAIFMNDNISGGTIFSVGLASAIFLLTHSILQIWFADRFSAKDRLWMLILGTILIAIVPFGFIFSTQVYHIYILQFIHGLGAALAYPSWYSLFTLNLDKGQHGYQYSLYSSGVSICSAGTALAGAWIVEQTSFELVFLLAGFFSLVGVFLLLRLEKSCLRRK